MNKLIAVVLSADAASFKSQMLVASGAVKDFEHAADSGGATASKFGLAAKAAAGAVALAFAAAAIATVKMAADFDKAMRNVNSISQLSEKQFGALEQSVLDLSKSVPQSATNLAAGLYDIASSGFQGAEGVKVLDAAAKAATAGLSDTKTSAAALVGVLNAYGYSADQAAQVSDVLFQTVNVGVLSFSDLAQGLGEVVGIGAAAHVSIQEIGAAVAGITLSGVPAAEAFTSLSRVIQAFVKPTDQLTNLFNNLGYESSYAGLQALGLHGAIDKIRTVTGGSAEAMVALFGDIRAARGAFALMANDGQNYARAFTAVTDQTLVAGATQRAFTEQMKSLSNQWDLFVNKIQAGAIEIGIQAIPLLVRGIADIQTGGQKLVDFAQAAAAALGPFLQGLGATVEHLGSMFQHAASDAKPFAQALAVIVGSGIVVFLNTLGTVLGELAGFLDHNRALVELVALAVGVNWLTSMSRILPMLTMLQTQLATVAASGFVSFIETAAIRTLYFKDAVLGLSGVGQSISDLRSAFSGIGSAAASAGGALLNILSSPGVAATGFVLLMQAVGGFNDEAQKAKENTKNLTDALLEESDKALSRVNDEIAKTITTGSAFPNVFKDAGASLRPFIDEIRNGGEAFHVLERAGVATNTGMKGFIDLMHQGKLPASAFNTELLRLADSGKLTDKQWGDMMIVLRDTTGQFSSATDQANLLRYANQGAADATGALGAGASGTTTDMSELQKMMQSSADAAKQMADNIKALDDALHASMDPLFGMLDAVTANQKALSDAADAHKKYGDASAEAQAADEAAAKSALDVESAAIKLAGAVQMGTVSVDQAKATLQDWVAQGLITQDQADAIAVKFAYMSQTANDLQGKNIQMIVDANIDPAVAQFKKLQDLAAIGVDVNFHAAGSHTSQQRWGGVVEHAQVGLLRDANVYSQPMYAFAEHATGGEAFIPKYGDAARSLAILNRAASWYGATVSEGRGVSRWDRGVTRWDPQRGAGRWDGRAASPPWHTAPQPIVVHVDAPHDNRPIIVQIGEQAVATAMRRQRRALK